MTFTELERYCKVHECPDSYGNDPECKFVQLCDDFINKYGTIPSNYERVKKNEI